MKKVLYIGWIGYKNLGDELMFDLFKYNLLHLGDKFKLDTVNNEERFLKNITLSHYDLIILGGGSILSSSQNFIQPIIIDTLYKAIQLNKKVMIWGSGIDWVPKSYINHLKNDMDMQFPISDTLRLKMKEVFEKSVWAGVRGPLTLKLLKSLGVTDNIHVSGDPGFLMNKEAIVTDKSPAKPFAEEDKVIAVNWGTTFNVVYGNNELNVEDALAAALNQLIAQGYKIYFYLVWSADLPATERLYNKINQKEHIILDKILYHQDELMAILEDVVFTINFKLHANYISLAAGVPFIAFGYRFKIFDFVESVDLSDYIISTDSLTIATEIISLENKLSSNRQEIIDKMATYQNEYCERLNKPFELNLFL
ncbi:polysaccharide pyruvyl transferase family protein [Oceanobacillus chungangensis]|uniref:Polysaccharide pyruvyl transferase family protein n=1 Tax=Oceanobacillus chungangensis TaxID=1229152 RepID=A0A3D8PVP8_9BACI|nr:polysaccharide pyruvyl transferase family protein [Oceanobacillus chungangensis]RDW19348.1 polysaccharide pyruvyl transferase family protein [Oceanobacillus chungangensis]